MKNLLFLMVLFSGIWFAGTEVIAAMVTGGVWHDEQKMAVAIDLNHPEWQHFNRMELDFNTDREWGQIIDGSEWLNISNQSVRRFEFGVYRNYQYQDGQKVRYFGWSHNPLYENEDLSSWFVFIDKLYYGEQSPESFQCFADNWMPTIGNKVVYCQSIDLEGNPVPVLASDLGHIFVRYEGSTWTPLSILTPPPPQQLLDMRITPAVVLHESKGQYLTAFIKLPDDLILDENHLEMSLHFEVQNPSDNSIKEIHMQSLKWCGFENRVKNGANQLVFKLPRKEIVELPPGEAIIRLTAQADGIQHWMAEGTITIR